MYIAVVAIRYSVVVAVQLFLLPVAESNYITSLTSLSDANLPNTQYCFIVLIYANGVSFEPSNHSRLLSSESVPLTIEL